MNNDRRKRGDAASHRQQRANHTSPGSPRAPRKESVPREVQHSAPRKKKRKDSQYKSAVWTPYWHMGYEEFWHFVPLDGVSEATIANLAAGHTASIGKMKSHIKYSTLDDELFRLLSDNVGRIKLRELLINTWL